MARRKPRRVSAAQQDRIYVELLLRWSRTIDVHGLSFERWLPRARAWRERAS
jgi:hypothetical protein